MSAKRVALVTGASRGIGRGIALKLAQQDWTVVINYRSNASAAEETVAAIKDSGGEALAVRADIASLDDHAALLDTVIATYEHLDLLVNNAGVAPSQRRDLLEMPEDSFDEVLAVNLKGPFFLTQRAARLMIDQLRENKIPAARIVNISSISAYTSSTNRGEYCIAKAGMSMMTLLFADRLAEHGINVYEVRPGIIETDMTRGVKGKYDALIGDGLTPIRRWGRPEDVADAVFAIAEGYLAFSTGEVINVDGGFHIRRL
jgi:NAD(P)-dependent dehydrogenase (short-subunit alcohol dehydrogenase family)